MPGVISLSTLIFTLALFWFVVYWIVGGVIFSIISVTRFLRVHKARFSCIFTLLSAGAAYGTAWMSGQVLIRQTACIEQTYGALDVFQLMFTCATKQTFSSSLLWFLLLMAIGIGTMLILRGPDERKMV
jgi:hypothetical protein